MIVHVTSQDILRAGRSGGDNPVSRALLRETSQAWVIFGGTMAYSRTSPHHVLMLPYEVNERWRKWRWDPFEFEVAWAVEPLRRPRDKRQRVRRALPRFGHDRRARDRRERCRRHGERRYAIHRTSSHSLAARGSDEVGSDRRDPSSRSADRREERPEEVLAGGAGAEGQIPDTGLPVAREGVVPAVLPAGGEGMGSAEDSARPGAAVEKNSPQGDNDDIGQGPS